MKKRYFFISIICSIVSAAVLLLAFWLPAQYRVPVLMYHAVAVSWHEPLNNVSPASFERQIRYIREHGYHVLTLNDFVKAVEEGRFPGNKSVVITFDDGYENNYTAAYPVLRKYGVPAAIFVEVARLDTPGRLTSVQLREMSGNGISIESHLMTGAYLPDMTHEQRVKEIVDSKKDLEKILGSPVSYLAYPIGGFNSDVKEIARTAGYKAGFATNRGYDRTGRDLYELKRIRIKDTDHDAQMWLKLSGYYNLLRSAKNPF